jgi:uncharacterized membrane protein
MPPVHIRQTTAAAIPNYAASRLWLFLAATAGLIAVVGPPLTLAAGHPALASVGYLFFSPICHQIPDRTFHLAGYPLALCARCFGLLLGVAAGAALSLFDRTKGRPLSEARKWLLAAALLMLVDYGLPFVSPYRNTVFTRLVTGLLLGHLSVPYMIIGWAELVAIIKNEGFPGLLRKKGLGGEITA